MKICVGQMFAWNPDPILAVEFPGLGVIPTKITNDEPFPYIDLTKGQLKILMKEIEKELNDVKETDIPRLQGCYSLGAEKNI
jgi:hypothetical protein